MVTSAHWHRENIGGESLKTTLWQLIWKVKSCVCESKNYKNNSVLQMMSEISNFLETAETLPLVALVIFSKDHHKLPQKSSPRHRPGWKKTASGSLFVWMSGLKGHSRLCNHLCLQMCLPPLRLCGIVLLTQRCYLHSVHAVLTSPWTVFN